MKKINTLFSLTFLLLTAGILTSAVQDENEKLLRFNGMYIAKTMEIQAGDMVIESYNYLRFYENGAVICQSVSGYDPTSVSKWFSTEDDGKYERKGEYTVTGKKLNFTATNESLPDAAIEGTRVDTYEGEIIGPDQIYFTLTYASGEQVATVYTFAPFEAN